MIIEVNERIASRVVERLKTKDLRKLVISGKPLKCLDLIASTQPTIEKKNFDICVCKALKISCKTFHRKTYFT